MRLADKVVANFQMLDTGESKRRLARWTPSPSTLTADIARNGEIARARCRDAVRNVPWGAKANISFAAALVGTGIIPSPIRLPAGRKKAILEAYTDWTDYADAEGLTDFHGMQAIVAREMLPAGECFIRRRPRFSSDGFPVPLQIQLLQGEMLPYGKNETLQNGNVIRYGIEFDQIGRRAAYHFLRQHPGEAFYGSFVTVNDRFSVDDFVRVPAEDVIHVFDPLEVGQIRGMPGMTAALIRMHEADRHIDAQLARQHIAALFAGFIRPGMDGVNPFESAGKSDDGETLQTGVREEGRANVDVEPGTFWTLRPGEEISFSELPAIGSEFEAFTYRVALDVATAMGMPYSLMTGDVRAANYSSERAARIGFRQHIEQMQHKVIVFQMCRQVWRWFLDAAALSGAVSLPGYAQNPARYLRVRWVTPKWEWVDPLDDIQAEKMMVDAGFKARSDVVESLGYDAEETDAKIAADKAREKALGLDFSAKPAATAAAGAGRPTKNPKQDQQQQKGGSDANNNG